MKRVFCSIAFFIALCLVCAAQTPISAQETGQATDSPSVSSQAHCSTGQPNTATQRLAKQLDAEGVLSNSVWGICAISATGDTLAYMNAHKRFIPASNMKLLTTGTTLLTLGSNFTYKTSLAADGPIKDSVLHGNLHLIGGGDPLIGNIFPYLPKAEGIFTKWDNVLEDNGIKAITGDIVGNGSFFCGELTHGDWCLEDYLSRDGVVPSGLTWRGKKGDTIPDGPYPAALHYLEWLRAGSASGITVAGDARQANLSGLADTGSLASAPETAGDKKATSDTLFVLGEIPSEPLLSLIGICNRQSDNFIAETLIKTLSKHYSGTDDYPSATNALHKSLSSLGLMCASGQMRFADGSGLSFKNLLSPEFLVGFLLAMQNSQAYNDYLSSLPYPGEKNTTLAHRLRKTPEEVRQRIRAKSGSMSGVVCLSGYILSGSGKASDTIAFSILVNNVAGSRAEVYAAVDELLLSLARENE